MAIQTCPYCNAPYMQDSRLDRAHHISFSDYNIGGLEILQHQCPECHKISLTLFPSGSGWGDEFFYFSYPPATAKSIPEYVPLAIRQDYVEAASIVDLSPKASATLSRRCLQGMIHDFWGITEKNLNAEITALKSRMPLKEWEAVDAIRKLGNIGAHMEKDVERIVEVDPDEAKTLLKVIEFLIQTWYVRKHDEDALLSEVVAIAAEKEAARSSPRATDGK
ncbi:MAG: DUF4145 domain-containing protein [Oscillibacter sp.]|nr:DUF4145 domain-containing protein [Oscillibacter sp.]